MFNFRKEGKNIYNSNKCWFFQHANSVSKSDLWRSLVSYFSDRQRRKNGVCDECVRWNVRTRFIAISLSMAFAESVFNCDVNFAFSIFTFAFVVLFFCALSFVVPLSLGCVVTLELVADLSAINHLLPHSEYMTLCLIMAEIIFNFSRLNSSLFIRVLEIDQVMFRRWIHFYFNSFQTQKQSNIMKYATKKRSTHRYYPIYQWHSNKIR